MVILFYAVVALAAVYLLAYLVLRAMGERIAFPAPRASYVFKPDEGFVWLKAAGGVRLAALWLPCAEAQYTLLYSHGNGEDLGEIRPRLEEFCKRGFNVLAYEYPGYGRSEGRPSVDGLYAAADAAWEYLTWEKGVLPNDIAVMGYSMGGAAACHLASTYRPRALILMGAFATALHAIVPKNIFPWVRMLDNERRIARAHCPVYMLHGTRDRVVPFRNGKRLYAAAGQPKYFARVRGAGHYSIPDKAPDRYWDGITHFIRTLQAEDSDR